MESSLEYEVELEDSDGDSGNVSSCLENSLLVSDCGEDTSMPTNESLNEEYQYDVLSTDAILENMYKRIDEINCILNIPNTVVRILLNRFGWDKQKLLEKYCDSDEKELSKEVGFDLSTSGVLEEAAISRAGAALEDCLVCYDEFPLNDMFSMHCGHRCCKPCWISYLENKILNEGVESISCIGTDCGVPVNDEDVLSLLENPQVKKKYKYLIANSFAKYNRLIRWCPFPACTKAIQVSSVEANPVTCTCSWSFCFRCGSDWHNPVECKMAKAWILQCADEKRNEEWMLVNTKPCPNPECNTNIEKNGGCNHMECSKCKMQFCWTCLKDWNHPQHAVNCNTFSQKDEFDTIRNMARASLEKYDFYGSRFANHQRSLKLEKVLYAMAEDIMVDAMEVLNTSWNSVLFVKEAVDTLCKCRQTLMYTYAFAFYAKASNQKEIFLDNQRDLEKATEKLSGYLEREISGKNISEIKIEMINLFRYCASRRKVLLDHVQEGNENNWWDFDNK